MLDSLQTSLHLNIAPKKVFLFGRPSMRQGFFEAALRSKGVNWNDNSSALLLQGVDLNGQWVLGLEYSYGIRIYDIYIYMIYDYDWLGMTQMTELQNDVWNTEHNQSVFFSVVWFLSFWANGQGCVWFHWFKHWNISRFLDLASRSKDREDPNRCVINGAERLLVTPFHAPHKIIRTQEATLNDSNQTITVTSPEMKTKFIRPHTTEECFQKHHCHLAKIRWNCKTTFVWLRNVSILNHATTSTINNLFSSKFCFGMIRVLAPRWIQKETRNTWGNFGASAKQNVIIQWSFRAMWLKGHEHVIKTYDYDSCNVISMNIGQFTKEFSLKISSNPQL